MELQKTVVKSIPIIGAFVPQVTKTQRLFSLSYIIPFGVLASDVAIVVNETEFTSILKIFLAVKSVAYKKLLPSEVIPFRKVAFKLSVKTVLPDVKLYPLINPPSHEYKTFPKISIP